MRRILVLLIALLFLVWHSGSVNGQTADHKIKVLIITGGHDYERKPFYEFFNSIPSITYDTLVHPHVNDFLGSPGVNRFDVLVFYDMGVSITPQEQHAYISLLKKGKAMIFLHHSLVSYQSWPEFIKIVGGQYHTNPVVVDGDTLRANYRHGVAIQVNVEDKRHPITGGINDFKLLDEVYWDVEILPTVKPLLSTSHPKSMHYLAWINHYENSDVIYIQPGHGQTGFSNPNFKKLIEQAIQWSADRHRSTN